MRSPKTFDNGWSILCQHCECGEWRPKFEFTILSTPMLNAFIDEAEHRRKTRNFRTSVGLGTDGSSTDNVLLDLKFNPWDTANTFRPELRASCKPVFTQHDPLEPWNIEQSSAWLDDVKTFPYRPMRCRIVVHPYAFHPDPSQGQPSAYLSMDPSVGEPFTPDLQNEKHVALRTRKKKTLSTNQTLIDEAEDTMLNMLSNSIPHGRTIMQVITKRWLLVTALRSQNQI